MLFKQVLVQPASSSHGVGLAGVEVVRHGTRAVHSTHQGETPMPFLLFSSSQRGRELHWAVLIHMHMPGTHDDTYAHAWDP